MKNLNTINDIIDFAISREQRSIEFYSRLAEDAPNTELKNVFLVLINEETKHKELLGKIKRQKNFKINSEDLEKLEIATNVFDDNANEDSLSLKDAMLIGIRRETASYNLYKKLSEASDNEEIKNIFEALSKEEMKHKQRFEKEIENL
ncbi:MAG: ferritin family protein [Bacteroidales bacterium]|jgi:rubrerythrin|nr:ferritin family protein [Bacteroidales bacterium]HOL98453.1 ferritin family protein [Bacteroidales bacterium]HOM35923.1 ferritin family protein [Bacteroidales bacterium]HPD24357.1 ferritin family protein [Bacteroidales bacterium]HRT00187.1 ferritin family protein [Bacteroidales bacterium]